MSQFAVIAENDESPWEDVKGEIYHFPNMYKHILKTGCKVIYYKGRMRDEKYLSSRLSADAHYFGKAEIGQVVLDGLSNKGDLFYEILNYVEFTEAIPIKINDEYIEPIPESKKLNYRRFGVREIDSETYNRILSFAKFGSILKRHIKLPNLSIIYYLLASN